MLTAAVRDLHRCYPGRFQTDVRTGCPDLWKHNPFLTPLRESDATVNVLDCDYPLIARSNEQPWHFLHGYVDFLNEKLGLRIQPQEFRGDIHLSKSERATNSPIVRVVKKDVPYWIIVAGGKYDVTIKWWARARFQEVVDTLREEVLFVQLGSHEHFHPPLLGALDLRGKTSLRETTHWMYHAQGVLSPVTFFMHLSAAVPTPPEQTSSRPCVVVAGGRESPHWEAYPTHRYLHTVGALACCETGGCWRSRTRPLDDGSHRDLPDQLCVDVVHELPRCMHMISAAEVVRQIRSYFNHPQLRRLTRERFEMVQPYLRRDPIEAWLSKAIKRSSSARPRYFSQRNCVSTKTIPIA